MASPQVQGDADVLALTSVCDPIPPKALLPVLSSPPFIPLPSLVNARDLGALPGSRIPAGLVFRCGALDIAAAHDPAALAWLAARVRRVFDLRRARERDAGPDPALPGVHNVWLPTAVDYPEPTLREWADGDGSAAWGVQYLRIAEAYAPTFRAVLEHVRDRPGEPFLFHCTAGRDRTGVLAGLLHHLAGTRPDVAARDYMLSRIGTEPARDMLVKYALASTGAAGFHTPGFVNLVDLRPAYWAAFLACLEARFGGWDGYVTSALGLSEEDLEVIKRNIQGA
ncbi:Tyrosine-protein phosphatase [Escovopsis weberi]|uniref:Tyrosine-protein phosphatase n=1 Tax=Escovopsis weberi TaxID=150374 RepID=A0A0M8N5H9_ESCWE|nr:Tyrosine-protein phosphatase [Escovopsis weberi]